MKRGTRGGAISQGGSFLATLGWYDLILSGFWVETAGTRISAGRVSRRPAFGGFQIAVALAGERLTGWPNAEISQL